MGFARRKRYKYKKVLLIISIIITLLVITGFTYYSVDRYMKRIEGKYISQIEAYELENYLKEKSVFVATEYIQNGSLITDSVIMRTSITSSLDQSIYFSEEDIGTFALIEIEPGLPIMKAMITSENLANDIRLEEFSIFDLPFRLSKNEFMDVRIHFPNGEDYIILSKKKVRDVDLEMNTVWLWLSEKEILDISSAMIDAYIHEGSRLYITLYVEPAIQEAAITTYPPNAHVLKLIEDNPNIVEIVKTALLAEARFYLEERLEGVTPDIPWAQEEELKESSEIQEEVQMEETETVEVELEEAPVTQAAQEGVGGGDGFFD